MTTVQSSSGSKTGKMVGLGCGFLFALPFAGFGVFAAFEMVKNFAQGKIRDGLFLAVFAVVFSCVGFGLMIAMVMGAKAGRSVDALKAAHPDEPWCWREDWANGRLVSSNRSAMYFAWILVGVWNLFAWGIFFAGLTDKNAWNFNLWYVTPFILVGVGLASWAVVATLRWKRFGQSWFKLLKNPGVIGGQLTGAVETSVKVYAKEGFRVNLRCVRVDSRGNNSSESVLWADEKTIVKDLLDDPRRSGVPVFFQIPRDCEPTDASTPGVKIIWRLEVRAKLDGPDYVALFEVPVFETAESSDATDAATSTVDPTLSYQSPREPYQQPAGSRIVVRAAREGGTEFIFPAARNVGTALSLTAFFVVWTSITIFLWRLPHNMLFGIVFGLVDVLVLLLCFHVWFKSSRVTIDLSGVTDADHWLFISRKRRFEASKIVRFETRVGMTSGGRVFQDIRLITKEAEDSFAANKERFQRTGAMPAMQMALGSPGGVTVASSIASTPEADWLVAEMTRALRGSARPPA